MTLTYLNISATAGNSELSKNPSFESAANSTAVAFPKRPTDFLHHARAGYWFQLVGCDGRQYGGLYSLVEAAAILESFKDCQVFEARAIGLVAKRAITATAAGRAAQ